MTPEAYRAHQAKYGREMAKEESPFKVRVESKSKHGAKRAEAGGKSFQSGREAKRFLVLQQMERDGLITELRRQVPFVLAAAVKFKKAKRVKPEARYYADFVYIRDGAQVIEDAKSPHLRKEQYYRLKKHLMMSVHGLEIEEV